MIGIPEALKEATYLFQHLLKIDYNETVKPNRATKIFCKIGPSCRNPRILSDMIAAGMDVACIDLAEERRQAHELSLSCFYEAIAEQSKKLGYKCNAAVAAVLTGTDVRISVIENGKAAESLGLNHGSTIILTVDLLENTETAYIFVNFKSFLQYIDEGSLLNIDGENIVLEVAAINNFVECTCKVLIGGVVCTNQIITAPNDDLETPLFSERAYSDLKFALRCNCDFIIVPQVQNADLIKEVRTNAEICAANVKIIAKIENVTALENIAEIIDEADAILLARTALLCQVEACDLLRFQKLLMFSCNRKQVPVICDTDFRLEMHSILSDAFDIGNAIVDGTSGIYLKSATPFTSKALEAVGFVSEFCVRAEQAFWSAEWFRDISELNADEAEVGHVIAALAVEASKAPFVSAIVVPTVSGRSAKLLHIYRPRCPILAVTHSRIVARQLNLYANVVSVFDQRDAITDQNILDKLDSRLSYAIKIGYKRRLIESGDGVIAVTPYEGNEGFRNCMHVVHVFFDVNPAICKKSDIAKLEEILVRRRVEAEERKKKEKEHRRQRRETLKETQQAEKDMQLF